MQDDATNKTNQSDKTDRAAEHIKELAEKPISDRDAQSVKGGRADESPKESKGKI